VVRRSTAALTVLMLLCLTAAACGGDASHRMTLTLQTHQPSGEWTTDRTVHVDCRTGDADGLAGGVSGARLCDSVMWYAGHAPIGPCTAIGYTAPITRVVMTGDDVHATVPAVVCNPPKALADAVGTIHTALGG
jgi:hypothetical protein